MKKLASFLILACLMLFITNCSENNITTNQQASWTLGNSTFNQQFMMKVPLGNFIGYQAFDKVPTPTESANNSNTTITLNSFSVYFKTTPTAGTYNIVFKPDPSLLANNELMINVANKNTNKSYNSQNTTVQANVTINSGKITVTIPQIDVLQEGLVNGEVLSFLGTLVEE